MILIPLRLLVDLSGGDVEPEVGGSAAGRVGPPEVGPVPVGQVAVARALIVGFIGIEFALAVLRPDLSIREDQISSYLTGPYRWLAMISFLMLSAGAALLAMVSRSSHRPDMWRVTACLSVYAVGVLIAGATDPRGAVHVAGALAAFAVVPVAAVISPDRYRIWWFAILTGSFATWPLLHFGLGERLTVLLELAWLLTVQPTSSRLSTER